MIAPIVVMLLAVAALVLMTLAIVRGIPQIVWQASAALGVAVIVAIPLSICAREKAVRIGDALMEPTRAHEYRCWIRFEPLSLRWEVHYSSHDVYSEDPSVSVSLLGGVSYGSKYFMARAEEIALR